MKYMNVWNIEVEEYDGVWISEEIVHSEIDAIRIAQRLCSTWEENRIRILDPKDKEL